MSLVGVSSSKIGNWVLEWLSSRDGTGETGAEIDLVYDSLLSAKSKSRSFYNLYMSE